MQVGGSAPTPPGLRQMHRLGGANSGRGIRARGTLGRNLLGQSPLGQSPLGQSPLDLCAGAISAHSSLTRCEPALFDSRSVRLRRRPWGCGGGAPDTRPETASARSCRTRGRGAEPPGAQRQPNLPTQPARYAPLPNVSQPNLPHPPTGYVLLLNLSQPNPAKTPAGNVLLLSIAGRYVLLDV
jgi:hypothetical protein